MLICCECEKTFREEDAFVVLDDPSPAGVGLPSGAYEYITCPFCGSDILEEAAQCRSCEEYFIGDETICPHCRKEVGDQLEEIRLNMKLTKDDFEQVIAEYFGW